MINKGAIIMKRLSKISLDLALLSFIPVISWFMLSIIVDKNLINIFTLIYPIQFIWYMLKSVFSTSANILQARDHNRNGVMSGIVAGSIIGFIVFGCLVLNIEHYIKFMNMDVSFYQTFAIYYVIQLYIQLIFSFILNKLYYEDKNNLANKYSLIFNVLNFGVLIGSSLIIKNTIIVIIITLVVISLFTIIIAIQNFNKFKFQLNLIKLIQYDSVDLFNNMAFFFIYLLGLSNALAFGEEFALAITFISLITDTQWDAFDAISVAAKIDISKNKFNYLTHRKHAYQLLSFLLLSTFIMMIALYHFYHLNLPITITFLSFELITFYLHPLYTLKTCYLQIEYSAIKTTSNKLLGNIIRILTSFLRTPYCTAIGQVLSSLYQSITIHYIFNKHYYIDTTGNICMKNKKNMHI